MGAPPPKRVPFRCDVESVQSKPESDVVSPEPKIRHSVGAAAEAPEVVSPELVTWEVVLPKAALPEATAGRPVSGNEPRVGADADVRGDRSVDGRLLQLRQDRSRTGDSEGWRLMQRRQGGARNGCVEDGRLLKLRGTRVGREHVQDRVQIPLDGSLQLGNGRIAAAADPPFDCAEVPVELGDVSRDTVDPTGDGDQLPDVFAATAEIRDRYLEFGRRKPTELVPQLAVEGRGQTMQILGTLIDDACQVVRGALRLSFGGSKRCSDQGGSKNVSNHGRPLPVTMSLRDEERQEVRRTGERTAN